MRAVAPRALATVAAEAPLLRATALLFAVPRALPFSQEASRQVVLRLPVLRQYAALSLADEQFQASPSLPPDLWSAIPPQELHSK